MNRVAMSAVWLGVLVGASCSRGRTTVPVRPAATAIQSTGRDAAADASEQPPLDVGRVAYFAYSPIVADSGEWSVPAVPAIPARVSELDRLPKAHKERLEVLLCAGHPYAFAQLAEAVTRASESADAKLVASAYAKLWGSPYFCSSLACGWAKATLERKPGGALELLAWSQLATCADPRLEKFFVQQRAPAADFAEWKKRTQVSSAQPSRSEAAQQYTRCLVAAEDGDDKARCLAAYASVDRVSASERARQSPGAFGARASTLELVRGLERYKTLDALERRLAEVGLLWDVPSRHSAQGAPTSSALLAARGRVVEIVDDVSMPDDEVSQLATTAGLYDVLFTAVWEGDAAGTKGAWRFRARRGKESFQSVSNDYGVGVSLHAIGFFNSVARKIGSPMRAMLMPFDDGTETMFVLVGTEKDVLVACGEHLVGCEEIAR